MDESQATTQTFVDSAGVLTWSFNWVATYFSVYLLAPTEKTRLKTLIWPLVID